MAYAGYGHLDSGGTRDERHRRRHTDHRAEVHRRGSGHLRARLLRLRRRRLQRRRPRRHGPDLRSHRAGDGLRRRPHLRRPLQPGRDARRRPGGRLPWSQVGIYMAAQLLGALLAGAVLFGLGHGFEGFVAEGNMGQNFFGDQGSGFAWWAALLLELLMTAVFVWVILSVTDARNEVNVALGPLAIGLSLAMIHFARDPADRHLGQPGPLDRRRRLRRHRRDRPAVALRRSRRCSAPRSPDSPTRSSSATAPRRSPARASTSAAAGRTSSCRATTRPSGTRASRPAGASPAPRGALPRSSSGASPTPTSSRSSSPTRPTAHRRRAASSSPASGASRPRSSRPSPLSPSPASPASGARPSSPASSRVSSPASRVQPGHWGNPDGDDDGRTQVRRPD